MSRAVPCGRRLLSEAVQFPSSADLKAPSGKGTIDLN